MSRDQLVGTSVAGYAINKEALAKVAFGGYAFPAQGVLPQGVKYAEKMAPIPYDVKKAKELLTEAGYPNGFESVLWSAYNNTTSQKTVPVAILSAFTDGDQYRWGSLMAGALVGSLPLVILYAFFVEHYVSAMTGAVKE